MKGIRKHSLLFLSLWLAMELIAQNPATVDSFRLQIEQDSLWAEWKMNQLFTEPVRKNLLSGLPVRVLVHFKWIQNGNHRVAPTWQAQLGYDIWEDLFSVHSRDQSRQFPSLDSLRSWWTRARRMPLAPLSWIQPGVPCRVILRAQVLLLQSSQGNSFQEWLDASQSVRENAPSHKRDTGFTFTWNDVIGLFMKKKRYLGEFEFVQEKNFLLPGHPPQP